MVNISTNMKKRTAIITVFCMIFTLFVPTLSYAATVSDISKHWARTTIQNWINDGYISGYPDGTFRPDNNISRAEFMTLVNKSFEYTTTKSISYTDVKSSDWYYYTVKIARAAGYISGYPDGSMRPNNPITREEAATIIMKINNIDSNSYAANIFDDDSLMTWSKGAIGAVVDADIMNGYPDGTFKPQSYIKRGESVVSLDRAIENVDAPDAPDVTRNDTTNTVSGITTAMEYKLDSADWITYRSSVFSDIDLNGNHTLLVRYKADGDIPYSKSTTLTFTANPLTAIKSIVGTAQVGVELNAGALTPSTATASYQWTSSSTKSGTYRNISGATSKKYTLDEDDEGRFLKVTATGTGKYSGNVTSTATAAVLPRESITDIEDIIGTAQVGVELKAGAITPSDATASYQWKISSTSNGTYSNISGATTSKYTPVSGDAGKYIKVIATGTGAYTGTETSTATSAVLPKYSLTAISDIIGAAKVGAELSAGAITPSGATVSYQWKISSTSNGTYSNISGATTSKYTLAAGDTGKFIKVSATGTGGYTGTVTSTATAAVIPKESITAIGDIIGTAKVGVELVAGTITPSAATVSYQWKISSTIDGIYTNISGATANKYTPVAVDAGKYIKVSAIGTGSYTGTVTSNQTEAVAAMEALISIDDIIGTAEVGAELRAGNITPSNATVNYQWVISDSANGSYSNIAGATTNKYTISGGNVNKFIRVIATGTGSYTGTVLSSSTSQIAQSAENIFKEAESAVTAYENAPITTIEEVIIAEGLKEPADAAVAKVVDSSERSALEERITIRAAAIAEARNSLLPNSLLP